MYLSATFVILLLGVVASQAASVPKLEEVENPENIERSKKWATIAGAPLLSSSLNLGYLQPGLQTAAAVNIQPTLQASPAVNIQPALQASPAVNIQPSLNLVQSAAPLLSQTALVADPLPSVIPAAAGLGYPLAGINYLQSAPLVDIDPIALTPAIGAPLAGINYIQSAPIVDIDPIALRPAIGAPLSALYNEQLLLGPSRAIAANYYGADLVGPYWGGSPLLRGGYPQALATVL